MNSAFFLDRDGTINIDYEYIKDPNLIELIPGSAQAIRRLNEAGVLVVIITNQSGVNRGLIPPENLPKVHERLDFLLAQEGAKIDLYKYCIHQPIDNCDCRKPKTKLVLDAAQECNIDLRNSIFVGDRLSDVATGNRAHCKYSILIRTGKGEIEEKILQNGKNSPDEAPSYICNDLLSAVDWGLARLVSSKNVSNNS